MCHCLASFAVVAALAIVPYRPPVDAPIVDHFRPPPAPWAAGNRGLEYRTRPGSPVRAAADGEVVFSGAVGGALHVVVLHADGIRTSYSFLRTVLVHRGDRVRQGELVGTAGAALHFGARVGDTYIDPAALLSGTARPRVRLVPDVEERRLSASRERASLRLRPPLASRPSRAALALRVAQVRRLWRW
jgi:murein DD-endopeptidase MepM/ murein hydrolase activator NlpD